MVTYTVSRKTGELLSVDIATSDDDQRAIDELAELLAKNLVGMAIKTEGA